MSTGRATSLLRQTTYDEVDLFVAAGAALTNLGMVADCGLIEFGVKGNDTAGIVNQVGGLFDLTDGDAKLPACTTGDTAAFSNTGTLERTAATAIIAAVTSTGTISVTSGTLSVSGGTFGGALATSGSAKLAFGGGAAAECCHGQPGRAV